MAARTRSPDRPAGNARAGWSIVVGLLGVAVMPLAVAATRWSAEYELLHAGLAIPVGLLVAGAAVSLSRSARKRNERTLGRAGGVRAARIGRALGVLGLSLALTAAVSVGVYGLLEYIASRD